MTPLELQLLALGATLAVELPIAAALAPAQRRGPVAWIALFANLASHSLASALLWRAPSRWLAVELGVVVFEALALHLVAGLSGRRAAALALAMNVPSAALALGLGSGF